MTQYTTAQYIGSWVQPYPFVGGQVFPDNGLITTNYDKRVTQNERLEIASKLFHSGVPYETKEKLDGTKEYVWDETFISLVEESLATGVIANFSRIEKALFIEYVKAAQDGSFANSSSAVKELNKYLAMEKK